MFYKKIDNSKPELPSHDVEYHIACWPLSAKWSEGWKCWFFQIYIGWLSFQFVYNLNTGRRSYIRCHKWGIELHIGRIGSGLLLWFGFDSIGRWLSKIERMSHARS